MCVLCYNFQSIMLLTILLQGFFASLTMQCFLEKTFQLVIIYLHDFLLYLLPTQPITASQTTDAHV
jgi:hypothetical protein